MSAKTNSYIFNIFIFLVGMLGACLYVLDDRSAYLWIVALGLVILVAARHYANPPLLIFFLFTISYSWVPYYFFVEELRVSFWDSYQTPEYLNTVVLSSLLFLVFFSIPLTSTNRRALPNSLDLIRSNSLVFAGCLIICIFSLVFGISGETILTSKYGATETEKSTLHEYFLLPFLGLLLSREKNNLPQEIVISLLLITYSFKTFVYGGRIEVLQAVLIYFYLTRDFLTRYSPTKLVTALIAGILILFTISLLRESYATDGFAIDIATMADMFGQQDLRQRGYISTNAGDVTHASMRILGLIDEGYLSIRQRFESFIYFLFGIIIPSSKYPEHALLASYMQTEVGAGGGGLIGNYFYVWLWWFGPPIAGTLIGFAIKSLYFPGRYYFKVYAVLILISFPRWYVYSPINLLKFCIVGVILIWALYLLSRLCRSFLVPASSLKKNT